MADLDKLLGNISDLPTLPDVVARVNQLVMDPQTSAADINDVISRDPSLSAKILKLVNSPYYGFARRITTITYAVVILGFNTVRNLAMSAFIFDSFRKGGKVFDLRGFWNHSVCTAIAAAAIARKAGVEPEEDLFMGGLLHGIGVVIMNQYLRDDLDTVMQRVQADDILLVEAERAELDYDHCGLGAELLERWNLPQTIVATTRHQTDPAAAGEQMPHAATIHLAEILARSLLLGFAGDRRIPPIDPAAWDRLGLSWDDVDKLFDEILNEIRRAGEFFKMA